MKVVFLARRYFPGVGGVERHIQGVIKAVRKIRSDLEIVIVTEQHEQQLPEHEVVDGVEIFRIRVDQSKASKYQIWSWISQHRNIFSTSDIVHIHDVFFWTIPEVLFFARPRMFMTFHGYEPPGPPNWKQRFWHQTAEILTQASIAVGGFHQKWYGVEPSIVTYGAVDVTVSKKPRAQRKAVFVGRLESDTGIWSYLESMERLQRAKSLRFQLDVVGDGPERSQLQQFVDSNTLPVRFLGSRSVTSSFYAQYQVALVSGYLSILEALASRTPVVSTYHSPLKKDYLCETPFAEWIEISAPGAELDHALSKSWTIDERAEHWAQQQSWEKLAEQYLQLWKI